MSNLPGPLEKLFKHVDGNKTKYISNLKDACAIRSVSAWRQNRQDIFKMADWVAERLKKLGATVELRQPGTETLPDGEKIPLSPVVLGFLGTDPKKKTVLLYGHLDVQPALKEDGWDTDPWVLTEKDGKLYARGATDDKGPVLCWLHAIEAYQAIGEAVPVNLKFCFEGMEEVGSDGLAELLESERNKFLAHVDYVCISDNYWLGTTKPCLTYGLRGNCYFYIEVQCAKKDLHSGVFGGTVNEAMSDLIYLLNTLVDKNGKILIDNMYDDVLPFSEEESKLYNDIEFDVDEYRNSISAPKLAHNENKHKLLQHRWRHPCLSIHGIEGAFAEPGQKTVIPGKVIGKMSLRTVPNQTPAKVDACVVRYLNKKWAERGSPNTMKAYMVNGGEHWVQDPTGPNFQAAARATKHVYKVEPDFTREGGSIPITLTLEKTTGKPCVLLPVGCGDDGAHSQNEKIDIRNYIEGTKLLGAYLYEIGQ